MLAIVHGLSIGALYGLLAIGIVLVFKATRVINFAQAEIGTFAAYATRWFLVDLSMPWWLAALCGLATVGIIGFVFERFVIRRMLDGPKLAIAVSTLGLLTLLGFIELKFGPLLLRPPLTGRAFHPFGLTISPTRVLALVCALAVGGGLLLFVKKTTFGLGLLASAQDPVAVRLMGIRLKHLSSFTWVASSVIGGLAGILILTSLGGNIEPFAVTALFLYALAAALTGGMTSIPGAFFGGLLIGLLQTFLKQTMGGISGIEEAGVFAVLVAILVLRPQGLFGKAA